LYIDDMLVAGSSMKTIVNLKASLVEEFHNMIDAKLVNIPI